MARAHLLGTSRAGSTRRLLSSISWKGMLVKRYRDGGLGNEDVLTAAQAVVRAVAEHERALA